MSAPPTLEEVQAIMKGVGLSAAVTWPEEVADFALESLRENFSWMLPPSETQDAQTLGRAEGIIQR